MRAEYKVPGGKLLVCEVSVEKGVVKHIRITGDFFMHPEEAIDELEKRLTGVSTGEAESRLLGFFEERKPQLFGVSPQDFARVLRLALESGEPT